jgi:hypothetical protein
MPSAIAKRRGEWGTQPIRCTMNDGHFPLAAAQQTVVLPDFLNG